MVVRHFLIPHCSHGPKIRSERDLVDVYIHVSNCLPKQTLWLSLLRNRRAKRTRKRVQNNSFVVVFDSACFVSVTCYDGFCL